MHSCLEASKHMTSLCAQALAVSAICLGLPLDLLEIVEVASNLERSLFLLGVSTWVILNPKSLATMGSSCAGLTISGAGFGFPQPTRHEAELAMAIILLASMSAFVMQTCFLTVISSNGDTNGHAARQVTLVLLFSCLLNVVVSLSVGVEIHSATENLQQYRLNRYRKLRSLILSPRRIPPCA
eukprot:Gregarina_sp_Poly_1__9595@NODE_606_length_7167_cov_177_780845_g464_i1_p3_GENE_NODE_606_length_7167_cov_177_780845_g464_i1NODE_606_length_7167_cov_177_780845_g464_i1_p3_ORF_typecomplete_len183_score21_84YwiC/PF14256_6/1_3e02YwiC/PF14256_6/0_98_NODE_606_length_7167_cov_177_780845_g464_i164516999